MVEARKKRWGPPPLSETEQKLRLRSMLPIELDYDPFLGPENMKKLISDLTVWVLSGRVFHRQASTVRGLIQQWIKLDEHQKLDGLERRLSELEQAKAGGGSP